MSENLPWVLGLIDEELNQLKDQKKQLSSYGKQKIREKMNQIPEDDEIEDILNIELTEEKKQELAEQREKLNAGFKQNENGEWYRPTLQELEKNERIDLAINEMRYILWGGQDGEEFGNSVKFIIDVLNSLRDD
jgi:hypothetical protein